MKGFLLFNIYSVFLVGALFAQKETLNIIYVDFSNAKQSTDRPDPGITANMITQYNIIKDSLVLSKQKIVLVLPKGRITQSYSDPASFARIINDAASSENEFETNQNADIIKIREIIYEYQKTKNNLAAINLFFFIPFHSAEKIMIKYSPILNFLLPEITTLGYAKQRTFSFFYPISRFSAELKSQFGASDFFKHARFFNNDAEFLNFFDDELYVKTY